MQLSTTTNQTIDTNSSPKQQVTAAKIKTVKQHTLWAHIKEDRAIQAMLVVVAVAAYTNIYMFL